MIAPMPTVDDIEQRLQLLPKRRRCDTVTLTIQPSLYKVQFRCDFTPETGQRAVARVNVIFLIGQKPASFGKQYEEEPIQEHEPLRPAHEQIAFRIKSVRLVDDQSFDRTPQPFEDPFLEFLADPLSVFGTAIYRPLNKRVARLDRYVSVHAEEQEKAKKQIKVRSEHLELQLRLWP